MLHTKSGNTEGTHASECVQESSVFAYKSGT
jgi:hypothetical protein